MAVEHWFDSSFGRAKPRLEIVLGQDLNYFEVNGMPGRFSNPKGLSLPTQKGKAAFVLLEQLAERQGHWVSVEDQIDVVAQSLSPEDTTSNTNTSTRTQVARDMLVYRLKYGEMPIVRSRKGSRNRTEIGIIDFAVTVSKAPLKS